MKKMIFLLFIFNNLVLAQISNFISFDKLTITISDFEISGQKNSPPNIFNWNANIILNGFEFMLDDRKFYDFTNQVLNDKKIVIKQLKAKISMENKRLKISNAKFTSPFLKADISADLLVDLNNMENTWVKSSSIKLDNLSVFFEKFIFDLEKEIGQALPKKGNSILIEASGPIEDLSIKGMDMNKLKKKY